MLRKKTQIVEQAKQEQTNLLFNWRQFPFLDPPIRIAATTKLVRRGTKFAIQQTESANAEGATNPGRKARLLGRAASTETSASLHSFARAGTMCAGGPNESAIDDSCRDMRPAESAELPPKFE